MNARFVPLQGWPGTPTRGIDRQEGRFKADYRSTLDLLDRELRMLGAREVEIALDLPPAAIRLDGWPRAGARPASPGVVLSFRPGVPGAGVNPAAGPGWRLTYPCDRFLRWEDNLRAIALVLEGLRMVDRYGVGSGGEQYAGWRSLSAPAPGAGAAPGREPAPPEPTPEERERWRAARRLVELAGLESSEDPGAVASDPTARDRVFRKAALRLHPDRAGAEAADCFREACTLCRALGGRV